MPVFNEGDDVVVTQLWYWGAKTLIWRGRYVSYLPEYEVHIVETREGHMSFPLTASIRLASE